jgi:hypothetical protein
MHPCSSVTVTLTLIWVTVVTTGARKPMKAEPCPLKVETFVTAQLKLGETALVVTV